MMRPIKFKVWDVDEKEWYKNEKIPYQLTDNEGAFYWADDYEWNRYPGEVLIVQYTGLKDINGTEIYEGDVLKRGDFPDEKPEFIVRFGQFTDSPDFYHELEYSGWYVERIGEREKYNTSLVYVIEMLDGIVCGNIYEGDNQ